MTEDARPYMEVKRTNAQVARVKDTNLPFVAKH